MLQIPKLEELSFLIYGLGLSGRSVIKFFVKNKINNFKVWDDNKKNISKKLRPKNLFQALRQVDFIVLAPGISLMKNKNLIKFKKKIITDIDLFYLSKNRCKSIVVTGTNGKSTTCKLLAHLLKKNKLKFMLGGNIGTPILNLSVPENGFAIIEASSFQLAHSKFINPDYAFFLNLSNDHLDWHGNMRNYLNSKLKIFNLQTKNQFALINKDLKKVFIKNNFLSKIILPKVSGYQRIKNDIKNDYLTSNMNTENMSFIYTFAKLLNIKEKSFISSMKSFKGLPHRFEIFLKKENIIFINDSKATSFKATEPALRSLNNIYWILGGLPKQKDKIEISKFKKKIIKCYLIGKNTEFFKKQIKNKIDFEITNDLKKTISFIEKDIKLKKNINKSILLSPAAASFDQFKNFEKRGNEFKKICRKHARNFF
tara:strand:+ start:1447 stop:2724 length:1278 start_codon:yes stop_codon:yes gene_type:complete